MTRAEFCDLKPGQVVRTPYGVYIIQSRISGSTSAITGGPVFIARRKIITRDRSHPLHPGFSVFYDPVLTLILRDCGEIVRIA